LPAVNCDHAEGVLFGKSGIHLQIGLNLLLDDNTNVIEVLFGGRIIQVLSTIILSGRKYLSPRLFEFWAL
jgi:hypothetical protein